MSTDARNFLNAFDSLEPAEQRVVAAEILRRSYGTGELSAETFDELAAEVFHGYDAEEARRGNS